MKLHYCSLALNRSYSFSIYTVQEIILIINNVALSRNDCTSIKKYLLLLKSTEP